jgi:serine/threonine-protein kinase HipA
VSGFPPRYPPGTAGPVDFPDLLRRPAFNGLPGVLADALPDAFGNRVIRAYFAARGQEDRALSPVQRLLYVGERALGALTFHPAEDPPARAAEEEALEVAALVADARRIIQGRPGVTAWAPIPAPRAWARPSRSTGSRRPTRGWPTRPDST